MTDEHRIKELGQLGEADFKKLCITARISSSRPDLDENGWDFFVEMPSNRLPLLRRDEQPSPVKLLCQVKATDDLENRRLSLKVSTFEKLATAAMPTFVFVLVYGGGDTPERMYLCHIGQERIAQTLKRIRELEAAGSDDLNHHTMTLTVRPDEEFRNDAKDALLKEIFRHTDIDANAYGSWKAELLKTLGYEKGRHRFSFTTSTSMSQLVDVALGRGKLQIESGTISDVRFDIELGSHTMEGGVLAMQPTSSGSCEIVASSRRLRMRLILNSDMFVPGIPGLAISQRKIRVVSGLVEAILNPPHCMFEFNYSADAAYGLTELLNLARMICICNEPDACIEFRKNGKSFGTVSNIPASASIQSMRYLEHCLDLITQFLGRFSYNSPIRVRPREIYEQKDIIRLINLAINSGKVTNRLDEPIPTEVSKSRASIFAASIMLKLADEVLVAFCYWQGRTKVKGCLITTQTSQCAVWAIVSTATYTLDDIMKMDLEFDKFIEEVGKGDRMFLSLDESALRELITTLGPFNPGDARNIEAAPLP